ncbi:MAG: putative metal-binding motif-containing protein [Candidatus Lernaella stagnicola]|nr:putative metal-binding motif-containing protein [Candidatus Lernaella stagnicola]
MKTSSLFLFAVALAVCCAFSFTGCDQSNGNNDDAPAADDDDDDDNDDNDDDSAPSTACYRDEDDDGYGDPDASQTVAGDSCPAGWVENQGDCNDADDAVHPDQPEYCHNNTDDNCNGLTDTAPVDWDPECLTLDPRVHILPDEQAAEATVELDRVLFPLQGNEDLLDLEDGDVIISGVEPGFLRAVTEVDEDGTTIAIQTARATLEDVFLHLDYSAEIDLNPPTKDGLWFDYDFSNTTLYQTPGLNVEITEGSFSFGPTMSLEADIGLFGFNRFLFALGGAVEANLEVSATAGGAVNRSDEISFDYSGYIPSINIMIGPVPVWIDPQVSLDLGYEAKATAEATLVAGTVVAADVSVGVVYQDGQWSPLASENFTYEVIGPEFDASLNASVKGWAHLNAGFKLYSVAGPYVKMGPYGLLELKLLPDCEWGMSLGVEGLAGAEVEILGYMLASGEMTVFDLNWPVAGGDCIADYYCDGDHDTYFNENPDGDCFYFGFDCWPEECHQEPGDDCNDGNPNIHPGAPERCDGIDNNCDNVNDPPDCLCLVQNPCCDDGFAYHSTQYPCDDRDEDQCTGPARGDDKQTRLNEQFCAGNDEMCTGTWAYPDWTTIDCDDESEWCVLEYDPGQRRDVASCVACRDDAYEDNDLPIEPGYAGFYSIVDPYSAGATLTICQKDGPPPYMDLDFFGLEAACSDTVTVGIQPAQADLDLQFEWVQLPACNYSNPQVIGFCDDSGPGEREQCSLTITVDEPCPHYINITSADGSVGDYTIDYLDVVTGPGCPEGVLTNGDDDDDTEADGGVPWSVVLDNLDR